MGCKRKISTALLVMVCGSMAAAQDREPQWPDAAMTQQSSEPLNLFRFGSTSFGKIAYAYSDATLESEQASRATESSPLPASVTPLRASPRFAEGIELLPPAPDVSVHDALTPPTTSSTDEWSLLPPHPSTSASTMDLERWTSAAAEPLPESTNLGGWGGHAEVLPSMAPMTRAVPLATPGPPYVSSPSVFLNPPGLVADGVQGLPSVNGFPGAPWLSGPLLPFEYVTPFPYRFAGRFGWWGVSRNGNLAQVGEYQSVDPSPFVDIDGLWSNGLQTLDYYATLLGSAESQIGMRSVAPNSSSLFFFQNYPHRLLNNPLLGFTSFDQQPPDPLPAAPNNFRIMKEDLNVGDDYAIHVQELRTGFKGKLGSHADWRLNVWSLRKYGQRQATAMAHCYSAPNATDSAGNPVTGIACHVLSQSQRIDWLTTEVEPGVEGHWGPATVEYKRTMRNFSTNDQFVTRPYDNFGFTGNLPYDVVPENYTAIDRLKLGLNLSPESQVYAYLFTGNTENQNRDTNRRFRGYDLRITDRPFAGIYLTGYAKQYVQTGQLPTTLIALETPAGIRAPINYDRQWAGFRTRWRPFEGEHSWRSGLSFNCGYEYLELDRENAIFTEQVLSVNQASTTSNSVRLRMDMRWNRQFDTFVLYRLAFINDPLFGVPVRNSATNSSLPTQEHLVEIGSTWSPVDTFLLSASFGINNSWHSSEVADFTEDSYPISATAWYAPTPRWTISGGLAFFSNWIDQDITLGSKSNPITLPASYGGQSDVINIGTTFARTERLLYSLSYEYVRGSDLYSLPAPYTDIGPLSNVASELSRFSAGLDYALRPNIDCYARYQLFDFQDQAQNFASGTASWILGGFSAVF